jgi:fructose-1,6-bisphosphatase/inositol monophosphatase family enzyme
MKFNIPLPRSAFQILIIGVAIVGGASIVLNMIESQSQLESSLRKKKDEKKLPLPSELTGTPYDAEVQAALEVAIIAGNNILEALHMPKDIEQKGTIDFVTTTDKLNEKIIFDYLRARFPDYLFIGEESTAASDAKVVLSSQPTWIVDPIDGTTNFCHTFPLTCVSIGLCVGGIPVVGVVVAPAMNEIYVGVKGYGAYLNGTRMKVSHVTGIKDALLLTELGYVREIENRQMFLNCIQAVLNKSPHAIRMLGSGVLDLCYVACGRLDALWTGVAGEGWQSWDYCAGALFVEEAGGVLSNLGSEPGFRVTDKSCIAASTPDLCEDIRSTLEIEMRRFLSVLRENHARTK